MKHRAIAVAAVAAAISLPLAACGSSSGGGGKSAAVSNAGDSGSANDTATGLTHAQSIVAAIRQRADRHPDQDSAAARAGQGHQGRVPELLGRGLLVAEPWLRGGRQGARLGA